MSTVYDDYLFACSVITPNSRYFEAFSFVRQKIMLGTPDDIIILEFSVLHNTLPTVYSVAKGETLTQEVLDRFKRGMIEKDRRQEQRRVVKPSLPRSVKKKPSPKQTPSKVYTERSIIHKGFYKVQGMERVLEWARLQTWWEPWKANYQANSQTSLHEFVDSLWSPLYLISSAFQWGITEEGSQYWNKADAALREHILTEIRALLMALKNRVSLEGPYTIGKSLFYDLTGYGAKTYGDEISLESLCADAGLKLTEAPNDFFTFSLTTISK